MNPAETLQTAAHALVSNKLRSTLTVLGIIIGVAAVIGVVSIGRGARASVSERIEGLGTNVVFVRPGAPTEQGARGAQGSAQTLTVEDAAALLDPRLAPSVLLVAPETNLRAQLIVGGGNLRVRALGTTPEYEEVRSLTLAEGRFIAEQDVQRAASVVVLGSQVAESLSIFPGDVVRLNNRPFTVVGVLESLGGTALGLLDDVVIVPITTVQFRLAAQRTAQGRLNLQTISVQAVSADRLEEAKAEVTGILRERHGTIGGEDDFTVTSQEDILRTFREVTDVFTIFLGSIAGISLMVGGIGIMNIMLVSVTERTREIGIRKAVGARRGDILRQFLAEAVLLSSLGGALGVAVGWGLSRLFEQLTLSGQSVQTQVTPDIVLLAVGVAVAIGLFFGLYPALRASRLDPIQALHYE